MADVLGYGGGVKIGNPKQLAGVKVQSPDVGLVLVPVRGARGRPGVAGASTEPFVQSTPASSWVVPVPPEIERLPAVTLYVEGQQCDTEIHATENEVTLYFPEPTAGIVILS